MPVAKTNRLSISYQQSGSGPDVVMVHGLAANLAFWYLKIVPHFTPSYHTTVYDLRGHGRSEMPPTGYTTRDLAEDLIALLDERGIQKAHLVGHSIGGSVCMHAAVLYPERVASLTLVECRLHAFQPLLNRDNESFWVKHAPELEARGITIPKNTPKVFYSLIQELTPLADQGLVNPNAIVDDTWILRAAERPPDSPRFRRWSSGGGQESSPRCSALKSRQIRRPFRYFSFGKIPEESRCLHIGVAGARR
jgi:pimeloyl-ACP methyl ester carboxylesterase